MPESQPGRIERIPSIDTLRGIAIAAMLFDGRELSSQLRHSDWSGFTIYDLVYPCFLLSVGLSLGLKGVVSSWKRGLFRSTRLFALGLVLTCISRETLTFDLGTLQCIAVSYAVAVTVLAFYGMRGALVFTLCVFAGYLVLTDLFPATGTAWEKRWLEETAFTSSLDRTILGSPRSEEGLLPTLCATTYMLFGFWIASLVRGGARPRYLFAVGVLFIAAGAAPAFIPADSALYVPILSRAFSPSYCLLSAGVLALFFLAIHLIETGRPRITIPFQVLGCNSIFAYTAQKVLRKIASLIPAGGGSLHDETQETIARFTGAGLVQAGWSTLVLAAVWILCFLLRRRRVTIRI